MKVSLQTCQVAKTIRVSFEWKYFSFAENVLEDQPEGGKNKRGICGRGWMPGWRRWCWMSTLGIECQSRQKVVRRRIGRPPSCFSFISWWFWGRAGRPSSSKKKKKTTADADTLIWLRLTTAVSFFISPRRFPPFAVEGKTRGSLFHRSTSAESVS